MASHMQEQLRAAISEARKDGLPADELDKANDALLSLVRERDVQKLQEAVASEDEDTLRRAILDAKQLELPDEEVADAQLALADLVQRRSLRQVELAISSSGESELKDAISEARKVGVSEDALTEAKRTLKQKALEKATKYLEDAKVLQEEDQLRDAIIEARKVDLPQEEVEAAQVVLNSIIQERQTVDLRRAVERRDEAELKDSIREARRQELASDEIEKSTGDPSWSCCASQTWLAGNSNSGKQWIGASKFAHRSAENWDQSNHRRWSSRQDWISLGSRASSTLSDTLGKRDWKCGPSGSDGQWDPVAGSHWASKGSQRPDATIGECNGDFESADLRSCTLGIGSSFGQRWWSWNSTGPQGGAIGPALGRVGGSEKQAWNRAPASRALWGTIWPELIISNGSFNIFSITLRQARQVFTVATINSSVYFIRRLRSRSMASKVISRSLLLSFRYLLTLSSCDIQIYNDLYIIFFI